MTLRNIALYRGGEHGVLTWDDEAGVVHGAFADELSPYLDEALTYIPAGLYPTDPPRRDRAAMLVLLLVQGFDVPEGFEDLLPDKPADEDLALA